LRRIWLAVWQRQLPRFGLVFEAATFLAQSKTYHVFFSAVFRRRM